MESFERTFGYSTEPDRWFGWSGGNTVTLYTDYGMKYDEIMLDLPRDPDEYEVADACYDMLDEMTQAEREGKEA